MATTVSKFEGSNFLQPTGFKVVVNRDRFKNLEFFAQSLQHPDVSVSPAIQSFRRDFCDNKRRSAKTGSGRIYG